MSLYNGHRHRQYETIVLFISVFLYSGYCISVILSETTSLGIGKMRRIAQFIQIKSSL